MPREKYRRRFVRAARYFCLATAVVQRTPSTSRQSLWGASYRIGARFPQQGSVVVGTDGMLVLPHGSAAPFVLPDAKMAALPQIDLPDRDHYAEFIDVVLGGGKEKCSANFAYAGPLTESVIIGNVAAHFTGETLEFDAKSLSFPKKREANQYLTRAYRKGYGV